MVTAAQRAVPTKWLISARTSQDAHGVGAASWSGRTFATTARVLTKARSSCLVSIDRNPLTSFRRGLYPRLTGRPARAGKGIGPRPRKLRTRASQPAREPPNVPSYTAIPEEQMAAVGTTEHQGTLAIKEKAKLRKVLGRLDLILFTACAIVGLDSIAAAAQGGAQAITWLSVSLLVFLVPYGMLVAELGSAFPVEGGPYEWARMSFGRAVGAVTAILYWLSNPLWVGGTLTAATITILDSFVLSKPLSTTWEIVIGLVFIWVTTAIAIIAFQIGKWGPNIGTFVKFAVVALFTVLFIVFITQHGRPHGTSGVGDLKPTLSGFLTAIGILVFMWVGFELSTGAAE